MFGGKIKKVSNVEIFWWLKVFFYVVFVDIGVIRNFSSFFVILLMLYMYL